MNDCNDCISFKYLNDMDDIYINIEKCNLNRKPKILIIFDDMITDMLSNEKLNPIVNELFIRGRKNILLYFITQSYFAVRKNIRLSFAQSFIIKIPNNREHQQIASNKS